MSASREQLTCLKVGQSIAPVAAPGTGDANGNSVDTLGFSSLLFTVLNTGAAEGNMRIQESADGTTGWADAAADDVIGVQTVALVPDGENKLAYVGNLGFARVVVDVTVDGPISASSVLGYPETAPVA